MTTEATGDDADKIREELKNDPTNVVDDTTNTTEPTEKPKPSDAEAKLLKETMKHKAAAKKAADDLKALQAQIAGVDLEEYTALKKEKEDNETKALESKGEYARLLEKQKEAANAKIKEHEDARKAAEKKLNDMMSNMEDLTTGQAFSNSKFVTDKLTLTPNKAKALYKSHFEFVDGKIVGYDKPKGEADRTAIVDASGDNVSFEAAIEAIINSDPDKDYLLKAPARQGAGSKPNRVDPKPNGKEYFDTTDKIAAGLSDFFKGSTKK